MKKIVILLFLSLCMQGCISDEYNTVTKEYSVRKNVPSSTPTAGVSEQVNRYLKNEFTELSIEKKEVPYTKR